jgi:VWFA-related protein
MSTRHAIDGIRRTGAWRAAGPAALCAALVAALHLAGVSAQSPQGQPQQGQPPPANLPPVTFRTEVRFIEVDAFVTNADGTPVADLTLEDFELYEDGKRQQIQSFSSVNLPIDRPDRPLYSPTAIEPDVRTNEGGEGRVYLILLDDIHVHPSRVPHIRAALHQFIERNFGANDLAAVARVRNTRDSQDFTNNPRLLLKAIDSFTGNVPRERVIVTPDVGFDPLSAAAAAADPVGAAALAAALTAPTAPGAPTSTEIERAQEAMNATSRVRELSEFLASVRGRRKALIFVSEGSPFDTFAVMGQPGLMASNVTDDTKRAIAAATRGNVTVYAIDPRALMPVDTSNLGAPESFDEIASTPRVRIAQDSLRELATETGGFAALNVNDLDGTFARIVRENSSYYLLGYSPTNDRRDGSYRRLEVKLRRPGLQVRYRNGYTASTDRVPDLPSTAASSSSLLAVSTALASPLPTSRGLPLRVFAAPYRGPSDKATVVMAIELDGSRLDFEEKDGLFIEHVEIAQSASDSNGRRHPPLRHTMALNLKRATYERVMKSGLRVLSQMDLPPGRYQLRVAAGSKEGKAGAVLYDLEIPDFSREMFTMSGLSLTSSRAGDTMTLMSKAPLPIGQGRPLVTSRVFDNRDTVAVFGEVYDNQRNDRGHTVDISTELRTDTGAVVVKSSEKRSSSELKGSLGGYGFMAVVPLKSLSPGIYVIHAEARLNAGDRPVVSRDLQINVR